MICAWSSNQRCWYGRNTASLPGTASAMSCGTSTPCRAISSARSILRAGPVALRLMSGLPQQNAADALFQLLAHTVAATHFFQALFLLQEQCLAGLALARLALLAADLAGGQHTLGGAGQLAHVVDGGLLVDLRAQGGMGGQGGDGLHHQRTGLVVRVLAQLLDQQAGHGLLLTEAPGHLVERHLVAADRRATGLLLSREML